MENILKIKDLAYEFIIRLDCSTLSRFIILSKTILKLFDDVGKYLIKRDYSLFINFKAKCLLYKHLKSREDYLYKFSFNKTNNLFEIVKCKDKNQKDIKILNRDSDGNDVIIGTDFISYEDNNRKDIIVIEPSNNKLSDIIINGKIDINLLRLHYKFKKIKIYDNYIFLLSIYDELFELNNFFPSIFAYNINDFHFKPMDRDLIDRMEIYLKDIVKYYNYSDRNNNWRFIKSTGLNSEPKGMLGVQGVGYFLSFEDLLYNKYCSYNENPTIKIIDNIGYVIFKDFIMIHKNVEDEGFRFDIKIDRMTKDGKFKLK